MTKMEDSRPFVPRTKHVVGRRAELDAIRTVIAGEGTRILCFVGPGGIGKTRLLEEVESLRADPDLPAFHWSGIIDLYHSEFRNVDGLEHRIIRGIDPEKKHFQGYWEIWKKLEKWRTAGVAMGALAKERGELTHMFIKEYNQLANQRRVVLCFDTLELLEFESDWVQENCGIRQENLATSSWFLDHLGHLENTVVLLAGRPRRHIQARFHERFQQHGWASQIFRVEGFSWEESLSYFDAMAADRPEVKEIPNDVRRRIWEYTEGHPIRLSLVIHLSLNGDISGLFPPRHALEMENPKAAVDEHLVIELFKWRGPVRKMLHYLALTREGLGIELLHCLEPQWTDSECRENIQCMLQFTFVKYRPESELLFLHDEIYALFDRFVLTERQYYREQYKTIANYYRKRLEKADNRQEQEDNKVALVHYAYQMDPWLAFWYLHVPWTEEATRGYDTSLDMRLRSQLLGLLGRADENDDEWVKRRLPREVIEQDAAVNWVRRYLTKGDSEEARDVAECVRRSDYEAFQKQSPLFPLFRGRFMTAYGEALLYSGAQEGRVQEVLRQAIEILRDWEPPQPSVVEKEWWRDVGSLAMPYKDSPSLGSSQEQPDRKGVMNPWYWLRARALGRAHNNLGYLYVRVGHYKVAIEEYRRARFYFEEAGIQDEMADTINNMAFLCGKWGYADRAHNLIEEALELRKEIGLDFPLALSYNTIGWLEVFAENPDRGIQLCKKALQIFADLEPAPGRRGVGLANLALGAACRQRGEVWKSTVYESKQDAKSSFEEAAGYLKIASQIFRKKRVDEPIRLWEACNELGSLYCEWGWLVRSWDEKEARKKYRKSIRYLIYSAALADKYNLELQKLDSLDDLAHAFADMGDFATAQDWLAKLESQIPPRYRIVERIGFQEFENPIEEYWLVLGKLHLQRAVWAYRHTEHDQFSPLGRKVLINDYSVLLPDQLLDKMAEQYALASAYFAQYSPRHPRHQVTIKSIYRRVKTLNMEQLRRMTGIVKSVGQTYRVDLRDLLATLEDAMGTQPIPDNRR